VIPLRRTPSNYPPRIHRYTMRVISPGCS
jgi:hypothetical protein